MLKLSAYIYIYIYINSAKNVETKRIYINGYKSKNSAKKF